MDKKRIFLSPPHMGGEEIEFVNKAFESNYIAPLGPMVEAFEQEFAEYIGLMDESLGDGLDEIRCARHCHELHAAGADC